MCAGGDANAHVSNGCERLDTEWTISVDTHDNLGSPTVENIIAEDEMWFDWQPISIEIAKITNFINNWSPCGGGGWERFLKH